MIWTHTILGKDSPYWNSQNDVTPNGNPYRTTSTFPLPVTTSRRLESISVAWGYFTPRSGVIALPIAGTLYGPVEFQRIMTNNPYEKVA